MQTAIPNWIDIQYTAETVEFNFVLRRISVGEGTEEYSGLAYPYPDGIVRLNIVEIYNSYLRRGRNFIYPSDSPDRVFETGAMEVWGLYRVDDNNETLLSSWCILSGGFDYETKAVEEDTYLSEPINGKADPRMIIYATQCKPNPGGSVTPI